MNKILDLGLGFLGLFPGGTIAADEELYPPAKETVILELVPIANNYGKFDGHGKLFVQTPVPGGTLLSWDSDVWPTYVYFPAGSFHGIKLENNLSGINVFLAAEIRYPRTVRAFTKKHLERFLNSNLYSFGSMAIGPGAADGDVGSEAIREPYPSAAVRARLKTRIRRYELPINPVVKGNRWALEQNVLTLGGAVEHWLIRGQVMPLRIDSAVRKTREPNGTFYPLPLIR